MTTTTNRAVRKLRTMRTLAGLYDRNRRWLSAVIALSRKGCVHLPEPLSKRIDEQRDFCRQLGLPCDGSQARTLSYLAKGA